MSVGEMNSQIRKQTGLSAVPKALLKLRTIQDYQRKVLKPSIYRNADDYQLSDGTDEGYSQDHLDIILERIIDWQEQETADHPASSLISDPIIFNATEREWEHIAAVHEHLAHFSGEFEPVKLFRDNLCSLHPEQRLLCEDEVIPFLVTPTAQLFSFENLKQLRLWPLAAPGRIIREQTILKHSDVDAISPQAIQSQRVPFQRFLVQTIPGVRPITIEHDWRKRIIHVNEQFQGRNASSQIICPFQAWELSGYAGTITGDALDISEGLKDCCFDDVDQALILLLTGSLSKSRILPIKIKNNQFIIPNADDGSGVAYGTINLIIQPGVLPQTLQEMYSDYYKVSRFGLGLLTPRDIAIIRFVRKVRETDKKQGSSTTWKAMLQQWNLFYSTSFENNELEAELKVETSKYLTREWRQFRTNYIRARQRLAPSHIWLSPEEIDLENTPLPTATLKSFEANDFQAADAPIRVGDIVDTKPFQEYFTQWQSGSLNQPHGTSYKGIEAFDERRQLMSKREGAAFHCIENHNFAQASLIYLETLHMERNSPTIYYETTLIQLMNSLVREHRYSEAKLYLDEWKSQVQEEWHIFGSLAQELPRFFYAWVLHSRENKAVVVLSCIDTVWKHPDHMPLKEQILYHRARLDGLRHKLGNQQFNAAWKRGKSIPIKDMLEYAISEDD